MEIDKDENIEIGIIGEGSLVNLLANKFIKAGVSINMLEKYQTDDMAKTGIRNHQSLVTFSRVSAVIITVLPDGPALESMLLGREGIVNFSSAGKIVVDMSSVSPELILELSEQFVEKEMSLLDAAIVNEEKSQSDNIQMMMIGGDTDAYNKVQPIFQIIIENVKHIGANGATQFYRQAFGVRKKRQ